MSPLTSKLQPRQRKSRIESVLGVVLAVAATAAVGSLVLEYGFRQPPWGISLRQLHIVQMAAVGLFILDRLVVLAIRPGRREYLRENVIDFLLIVGAVIALGVIYRASQGGASGAGAAVVSAGALYVAITQIYLLVALLLRGVAVNLRLSETGIPPLWLLVGSFAGLVAIGTGLLMLPVATPPKVGDPNSFLDPNDALFTATSAVCVTGLVTKDTGADFTLFGQVVILALIQAGGLGIMLFGSVLAMMMGKSLTFRHAQSLSPMLASENVGHLGRLAVFVIGATLLLESAGALGLYPMFAQARDGAGQTLSTGQAIWFSVFHSVSAFCNAGFSLYGRNLMAGAGDWPLSLRNHWQVMGVLAPLIVIGGLGFPVLQDVTHWLASLGRRIYRRIKRSNVTLFSAPVRRKLSLHSKLALTTSGLLIVIGAVGLLAVEEPPGPPTQAVGRTVQRQADLNDWQAIGYGESPYTRRIEAATFQSISARTAGFNTIDMAQLSDAGKLWMCGLMFIGGSPASTAGGIKTVTFALLLAAVWSQLRHREEVEAFKRSIALTMVYKAVTLVVLFVMLVLGVTLLLSVVMRPGFAFVDLLFEAVSACGTVGLSTGITPSLNFAGKYIIIFAMFAGRLGPLTLLLALTSRLKPAHYSYPAENLVIG